jgi:hypothetical protein
MDGVVLLSEIHPLGPDLREPILGEAAARRTNPLAQAKSWFDLLRAEDIDALQEAGSMDCSDALAMIDNRCSERGDRLVIREWSHIDFLGQPFTDQPIHRSLLDEMLSAVAEVRRAVTVRHPIPQWLSLNRMDVVRGTISIVDYLAGCRAFAEMGATVGFWRFEDFTTDPEPVLRQICGALDLPFDERWRSHWREYRTITGDALQVADTPTGIAPVDFLPVPAGLREAFASHDDYWRILELLGYAHPDAAP